MGASHEMGRNESCVWGSALPAVVQSIHWPASAAPVAVDPRSPWWIGVFCLRAGQTDAACQHSTFLKQDFLYAGAKMDLCSLRLSFVCG